MILGDLAGAMITSEEVIKNFSTKLVSWTNLTFCCWEASKIKKVACKNVLLQGNCWEVVLHYEHL